jgi:glutamate-1-semialdehyde aminotransferase
MVFDRVVVPKDGYLAEVHALCKKYNVLLMCDEIQTVCLIFLMDLIPDLLIGSLSNGQDACIRV